MIKIPDHHKHDLLRWLHENVAGNQPCLPKDRLIEPQNIYAIPYHLSTTAQIAYWQGYDKRWEVHQASRNSMLIVECQDPEIETYIAMRWS